MLETDRLVIRPFRHRDLAWMRHIYDDDDYPRIDVTYLSVAKTAGKIVNIVATVYGVA